jgi:hypothetical protein
LPGPEKSNDRVDTKSLRYAAEGIRSFDHCFHYNIENRNVNRGISMMNIFGPVSSAGLQRGQVSLGVRDFGQAGVGVLPEVEKFVVLL